MQSVYPKSIVSWTDRINGEIIWAADPNSIAAEVVALENAIGVNPSVESNPPFGPPQQYSSLSSRVSAAMLQTEHPFISLELDNFRINWQQSHGLNAVDFMQFHPPFRVRHDDWHYFDGTCMTVRAAGLYLVIQNQQWEYRPSGWCRCHCRINDDVRRQCVWNFDQFPQGNNRFGQTYNGEFGYTDTIHFEILDKDDIVRLTLGNATDVDDLLCMESTFEAYYLRQM